jgi:bifunctional DNA-binding transcriptional regulator/antitoxin component of YhaV-PrlF toxin-antitoxin module
MLMGVKETPDGRNGSKKAGRRRGHTRISSKNQVTLPVAALAEAGLKPGDELKATVVGQGKVLLEQEVDPLESLLGSMTGVFEPGYLRKLREEWDRR